VFTSLGMRRADVQKVKPGVFFEDRCNMGLEGAKLGRGEASCARHPSLPQSQLVHKSETNIEYTSAPDESALWPGYAKASTVI
jgi:hypothetical protein